MGGLFRDVRIEWGSTRRVNREVNSGRVNSGGQLVMQQSTCSCMPGSTKSSLGTRADPMIPDAPAAAGGSARAAAITTITKAERL